MATEAQKKAAKTWKEKNKDKVRHMRYRTQARTFIRDYAEVEELEELKILIRSKEMKLNEKLKSNKTMQIDNDDEYYYCVGKLFKKVIDNSEMKTIEFDELLRSLNVQSFKDKVSNLFIKFNSNLKVNEDKEFDNLVAMIFAYKIKGNKVDKNKVLQGFSEN